MMSPSLRVSCPFVGVARSPGGQRAQGDASARGPFAACLLGLLQLASLALNGELFLASLWTQTYFRSSLLSM